MKKTVGTLAILNLAAIAIIYGPPHFSNASRPVRGIANPVLAMEVVRDVAEVDTVLSESPSPDREVMRVKQYADFGFIACYASLFVAVAMLFADQGRKIAIAAGSFGLMAAACDVVENLAILRILDVRLAHTTQAMIDGIRYPSLIKWATASLAMALLSVLLLRTRKLSLRIVAAIDLIAALLAAAGVFENVLLTWSGLPLAAGFLSLAICYFRPYYRRRGA